MVETVKTILLIAVTYVLLSKLKHVKCVGLVMNNGYHNQVSLGMFIFQTEHFSTVCGYELYYELSCDAEISAKKKM